MYQAFRSYYRARHRLYIDKNAFGACKSALLRDEHALFIERDQLQKSPRKEICKLETIHPSWKTPP